jgi:hypothetical protein
VGLCLRRLSGISADNSWLGIDSMARNVLRSVPAGGRIVRNADSPVLKGFVLRYNRPLPLSWVKSAKFVCHMAGTMKFSEAPPYPYTCRSLRPTRTGKMRDKVCIRCSRTNGCFGCHSRSEKQHGSNSHSLHLRTEKLVRVRAEIQAGVVLELSLHRHHR